VEAGYSLALTEPFGICACGLVLLVILALSIKEYPLRTKIRQQWTSHLNKLRELTAYLDDLSRHLGL
jgi:hypothetical protein